MTLKALIEKKESLKSEMKNLLDSAKTENRALNDEDVSKFNALEKEIKEINNTIDCEERAQKMENTKTEQMTIEQRESQEFTDYIRGVLENRAESQLTQGENGVIIPTTIAQKIIAKAYDMSTILQGATKYNTKGKLSIPMYTEQSDAKISMAYADEFKDLESHVGNFKNIELNGYLAGALTKISKSLVSNADIDLEQFVINQFAEAIALWQERECLYGTSGKIDGLSKGITLEVTTASNSAITAVELIKLKNKIKKRYRGNAKWIMSNDTLSAIETLTDNEGRFLLHDDLTGEADGILLGYPVETSDNMKEIGAGNVVIYFGDYSGLAIKQRDDALELNVLREKFATQHAIGVNAWVEMDAKVEDAQKIAKLTMAS